MSWNPRNLQFGHLRGDRFSFHLWTQMKGAALVEPNIPVVQKCSRSFWDIAHPSPTLECRVLLDALLTCPFPEQGLEKPPGHGLQLGPKKPLQHFGSCKIKKNILLFRDLGQRQCIKTKSLLCLSPLRNACMDDCL